MIFLVIAIIIFALDTGIKYYVKKRIELKQEKEILGRKILLTRYHNYGAMMNSFAGQRKKLIIISSVIFSLTCIMFLVLLPKRRMYLSKLAMSFIVGGGASNLLDRVLDGYVTDYFSFRGNVPKWLKKIVFNLGDIFVFAGAFILLIKVILE